MKNLVVLTMMLTFFFCPPIMAQSTPSQAPHPDQAALEADRIRLEALKQQLEKVNTSRRAQRRRTIWKRRKNTNRTKKRRECIQRHGCWN